MMITEARSYVNCKWRHRGRSRFGIDCIGLMVKSLEASGFKMRDRIDYSRTPHKDGLKFELIDHFGESVTDIQPGDIALIKWDDQKEPSHVGIVTNIDGHLGLIHSCSQTQVSEHNIDSNWRKRIVELYRPFP